MNDLMSFGIHRCWKRIAVEVCAFHSAHRVLDVAGGTGDLSARISQIVGEKGQVFLADINSDMLAVGRQHLLDKGLYHNIYYVRANAEKLPFVDNYFDRIVIGFGLRNVTDKAAALASMYRVLKPGGRLCVLEFSTPTVSLLQQFYEMYSFKVLPLLGKLVANDSASYRYLAESIRMHPDQETLKNMLLAAGFEYSDYKNLSGGIVAIHRGVKY